MGSMPCVHVFVASRHFPGEWLARSWVEIQN
jgi:hypothetical protein